eukprot:scaffold16900_cov105-Isochrysis_galbana.AAC.8
MRNRIKVCRTPTTTLNSASDTRRHRLITPTASFRLSAACRPNVSCCPPVGHPRRCPPTTGLTQVALARPPRKAAPQIHPDSTFSGCASVLMTCVSKSRMSSSEKSIKKYLSVSASQNVCMVSSALVMPTALTFRMPE